MHALADEPLTSKQVAEKLHKTPGNIHYHIIKLFEGGLLELVRTEAAGGIYGMLYGLFLMPFIPNAAASIALFAVEGFGLMIFGLIWEISLQELVPQEAFGRVASLDLLGSFALLPVGYILVGWLADLIGGIPTIAIFSGLGLSCAVFVLCIPAIRKFQ